MSRPPLPIDPVLPAVLAAVAERGACVLEAPTGAGKTTRVPPALLDACAGRVVLVEPRRLAARAAARRIAHERGVRLGDEVGYRVRFDDRSCAATRLLCVTEGILVRMLQDDPFLEGVDALVFDEFHERNLFADLALAMARRARDEARPDLALVVMSATLEVEPIARWLDDAPIVTSPGRLHPVELRHLTPAEAARRGRGGDDELLTAKITEALEATAGHVLVFLPGVPEIRRARAAVERTAARRGATTLELYGDLGAEEQDRIVAASDARKLILATNVAETSVTIEGVGAVVDTGLVKRSTHEPSVGLDRLRTERVSRASADQRAGRAGRTGPGVCLRLWTEAEDRALEPRARPEIARVDLASAVLELACWGETDPAAFPWFEAPPAAALERARELLLLLGAVGTNGAATALGRELARLPVHPRLGRLMLAGRELGAPGLAALAAALLAERDPFVRERGAEAREWSDSDLAQRAQALRAFERSGATRSAAGELRAGAARGVLRARDQFLRLLGRRSADSGDEDESALARAVLAAFPDRVARRRADAPERAVCVGGTGLRLATECSVREAPLFCAVDVAAAAGESVVRLASAVEETWLDPRFVATATHLEFDADTERVRAERRTCYRDLVLEAKRVPVEDAADAARILEDAARAAPERALDLGAPALTSLLARVEFLREACPELGLPSLDTADVLDLLPELCAGRRSFAELRAVDVAAVLESRLGHEAARALRSEAPEALEVPSGSRIRLTWERGRPPVLAVRIQELFGLAATPRVARGRRPVLLQLLAPNMRPQQITDDLASFWSGAYAVVRKELRRRYPKHSWPDDPANAPAVRGVPRRRR